MSGPARRKTSPLLEEANISIGGIGFQFIKKFGRYFFNGKVVRILENEKRVCKFNDGEHKQYSLSQLEKFSADINAHDSADVDEEYNVEKVDEDEEIELDVGGEENTNNDTDTRMPEVLSGNFMKKLSRVPLGMSLAEHIDNLKARPSARDAYASAMEYPKNIVENRFS